jgi:ribosome-associated toxin RatA of RatAB toxin-antitoxin module
MEFVEGPFKALVGRWTFEPIADRGTKVSLTVDFEFSNPMMNLLAARSFEKSCGQLVDAFVSRARAVYGNA